VYYIQHSEGEIPWDVGLRKQRDAALKALALDPDLAEAHMRAASSYWLAGDDDAANFHFYKAMALAPNDPLILGVASGFAASEGRLEEAIELMRRAAAVDPLSAVSRYNLGAYLYYAGRFDEAETELSRARELGLGSASGLMSVIHILRQDFEGALAIIPELSPGTDRDQCLALAYQALGRRAEADAALARLIAGVGATEPWWLPEVQVAEAYAYRGDTDEAFKWLRKSIPESRTEPGSREVWMLLWQPTRSPLLVSLHDDPRWQAWLADSRFEP
jgi:tetratricopeptide (TPR) repeat protein